MIESILEKAIVRLHACDYQLKITRKASQLPYDFSVSWGDIKKDIVSESITQVYFFLSLL